MKVIVIDTPKGQYTLPLIKVEIDFIMDDDYEGIDWLINNSDWEDWKDVVLKINDKVNVTDDDFWTSSDGFEIVKR